LVFVGSFFTVDAILLIDPSAEVNELTSLRTKGTIGVPFPTD
jgi:hypothetical protein